MIKNDLSKNTAKLNIFKPSAILSFLCNLPTCAFFLYFSVFKQIEFFFAQFGGNFPLTEFWLNS